MIYGQSKRQFLNDGRNYEHRSQNNEQNGHASLVLAHHIGRFAGITSVPKHLPRRDGGGQKYDDRLQIESRSGPDT